jgi:hypothetical protein
MTKTATAAEMKWAYAETFGPTYGRNPPVKLHLTDGSGWTKCGLRCTSKGSGGEAWGDVCGRCQPKKTK